MFLEKTESHLGHERKSISFQGANDTDSHFAVFSDALRGITDKLCDHFIVNFQSL